MESDTEWEDQLKAYFKDSKGHKVITSTLQKYFETNRSQNITKQQEEHPWAGEDLSLKIEEPD